MYDHSLHRGIVAVVMVIKCCCSYGYKLVCVDDKFSKPFKSYLEKMLLLYAVTLLAV